MKSYFLFFILFATVLSACSPSGPKQEAKTESYTSSEIGWTIEIPIGFKMTSKSKINANDQKGKDAIGKVYEGEINIDSLRHLVSFQKNQLNLFDSTIEPYVETRPGEYEENNKLVKQLLFDTYNKQKIKIDTSANEENIQGQKFNAFYIKVYGPDGAVIMNQVMYSKLINGFDFGVNIVYNNEMDKKLLLGAFKQSRFNKN